LTRGRRQRRRCYRPMVLIAALLFVVVAVQAQAIPVCCHPAGCCRDVVPVVGSQFAHVGARKLAGTPPANCRVDLQRLFPILNSRFWRSAGLPRQHGPVCQRHSCSRSDSLDPTMTEYIAAALRKQRLLPEISGI